MANINKLICAAILANTGNGACCFDFTKIIGAIKVPKGAEITEADALNLQTFITSKIQSSKRANRWYPIGDFYSLNPEGGDARTASYGYGREVNTGYNDYKWTFETSDCAACESWQYQSHNGKGKHYFFFIAEDGTIIGRKTTRPLSATNASPVYVTLPIEGTYEALPFTLTNGTEPTRYYVKFTLPVTQLNYGNAGWITPTTDAERSFIDTLSGLRTIVFVETLQTTGINSGAHNSHTTTLIDVFPFAGCDQENQAALLAAFLATANWRLTNATTGATVAISSVTLIGTAPNQQIRVTYPTQVVGTKITLSMADPTVLAAAGLTGWDSSPYTFTV